MAGYTSFFIIGGLGGFNGADGVNPITLMILIGNGNRQWLEPHYFDTSIKPMGKLQTIIPHGPGLPDSLLDACIAFHPEPFRHCPSYATVAAALQDATYLDFDHQPDSIPPAWTSLREEARPIFASLHTWMAEVKEYNP
jgi:hypothetical protein